jgi:hypothetical protein
MDHGQFDSMIRLGFVCASGVGMADATAAVNAVGSARVILARRRP